MNRANVGNFNRTLIHQRTGERTRVGNAVGFFTNHHTAFGVLHRIRRDFCTRCAFPVDQHRNLTTEFHGFVDFQRQVRFGIARVQIK